MKLVVAKRAGRRGSGLGNESLWWAKGWIASQVLGARLVGPSWGINRRRYYLNFRTSRLDFLLEDALVRLPNYSFTEEDYWASGEIEFGAAVKKWAAAKGLTHKTSFIVKVEGMWGGFSAIRTARPFLMSKLLQSRDALANVHEVLSELDPGKIFVAVHMRSPALGFSELGPGESARGRFNLLIPPDWYMWVCQQLQNRFGDQIQFRFFTDRAGADFEEAVRRFNPGQRMQTGFTECSDCLLMAEADLRVCSVSSYSMLASFLSGGPYLWYEPQLTLTDGQLSMWTIPEIQQAHPRQACMSAGISAAGQAPAQDFLGSAMDVGDPLPQTLVTQLENRLRLRDPRRNLLVGGFYPQRTDSAAATRR